MNYLKVFGSMMLVVIGLSIVKLNIMLGLIILFILVNILLNPPSLQGWLSRSKHKVLIKKHIVNSIQFIANYIFLIGLLILFQLAIEDTNAKTDITLGIGFIILSVIIIYKKKKIVMFKEFNVST